MTEFDSLEVWGEEAEDPGTNEGKEFQVRQFPGQDIRDDHAEGWALVSEKHSDIALPVFQVAQRDVKRNSFYVLSRPIWYTGERVGV